ncbi:MAG TPA: aspartate carbamoyltransferase catalytic subunit [Actinobacteria bacterium]|nr:aspartate carbamoyltransferase catalytic subunit [Actinomycetota bacterium]
MILRNILDIDELNKTQILKIIESTGYFKEVLERDLKKVPALRGKTIVNIFYEPSTRTRTSFELAAKRLSADVLNFSPSSSSLKKGETELDTIRTILAMKADLAVIRHKDSGFVKYISENINIPVINAGDGKHAHPTQALLDLFTIYNHFKSLEKIKIAIVGDILNSRVARSDMLLFKKMDFDVSTVSPSMLLPEDMGYFNTVNFNCIDDIVEQYDVIYMLRMQFERQNKKFYPSVREYNRFFSMNLQRFGRMKKGALLMHPGPVNRGIEIDGRILDMEDDHHERIKISEQVENGVAVRMALLHYLLSNQ